MRWFGRGTSGMLSAIAAAAAIGVASGAASPIRIAALRQGEVWTVRPSGGWDQRQTSTGGKVEDFQFSPRGEYLAYAKRIRAAEERPICSIVVVNASTGDVLKEIAPEDGWIDIDKWIGTRLLYHASSGMEVSAFFEFDAARRIGRELDPATGSRGFDTDLSPDGSLFSYVDDVGVGPTFQERLHLVQTSSGADAIAVSKRSIIAPAIATSNAAVAFMEVADQTLPRHDRIWVYRRPDQSVMLLADQPVSAKSSGTGLKWSPDDRYLSLNFGSTITVLNVADATIVRTLRGTGACWSDASTLVFETQAGIETVDVLSRARRVRVTAATSLQCL
jgi:hypothetical protein